MLKAALMIFFFLLTVWNVKGISHSDEPTENYLFTVDPHIPAERFSYFQLILLVLRLTTSICCGSLKWWSHHKVTFTRPCEIGGAGVHVINENCD